MNSLQHYVDLSAKIGRYALPVVIPLFVADIVGMVIYTIRHGSDDSSDDSDDVAPATVAGLPGRVLAAHYRARARVLVSKEEWISDDSLVDGTATPAQQMLVRAMKAFFLLFWLIFVCVGFILVRTDPTGVLFLIVPSIWFFGSMRLWRKGAREARERLARKRAKAKKSNDAGQNACSYS